MKTIQAKLIQASIIITIIILFSILTNNISINLARAGIGFSYKWLFSPSGFALSESALYHSPSNSYAWSLFIGWLNSLKVIFSSLIVATLIGFLIGIARVSRNILLKFISATYITVVRQTPLLLQLMFWYFVGFLGFKNRVFSTLYNLLSISNQGIYLFGINLSAEFSALIIGLSIFTGAYIAEIVRGGINSVPQGQWEAFRSIGLSDRIGLYRIIIPQALPVIIPALTSQYLNLAKNSTLAIAVGYADIYAINDTIINQTGRAVECFILLLISFLLLNLLITNGMEIVNRLVVNTRINY